MLFIYFIGCLVASVPDSRSSSLASNPGRGHCVGFLGKTLCSHSASYPPHVLMGTSKCNAGRTL